MIHIKTNRLSLRDWLSSDIDLMTEISASKVVMEYFPAISSVDDTIILINKIKDHFIKYGYGLYAVELVDTSEFIGFVGLNRVGFNIPGFDNVEQPIMEIGWRLSDKHWGKGFAPEAAKAVLKAAFEKFKLDEVVSFTAKLNTKSIRVMEKIGLTHNLKDDFLHPKLNDDSNLRPHVLYRLNKSQYFESIT